MTADWEMKEDSLVKKIEECFENEERARRMMEQVMMELEIMELKYKKVLLERGEWNREKQTV